MSAVRKFDVFANPLRPCGLEFRVVRGFRSIINRSRWEDFEASRRLRAGLHVVDDLAKNLSRASAPGGGRGGASDGGSLRKLLGSSDKVSDSHY